MPKLYLLIGLVVLVAVVGYGIYIVKQIPATNHIEQPIVAVDNNSHTFTDAKTNQSITVSFNQTDQTATLNSDQYQNVVFQLAMSASGARYTNDELGLVLWNKSDEMTLYQNDQPIFTGREL